MAIVGPMRVRFKVHQELPVRQEHLVLKVPRVLQVRMGRCGGTGFDRRLRRRWDLISGIIT
jgi:hypothetical protein